MRKFEVEYDEASCTRLIVAKDRITVKIPKALPYEQAKRMARDMAYVASQIPADIGFTVRGRLKPGWHSIKMKRDYGSWSKDVQFYPLALRQKD